MGRLLECICQNCGYKETGILFGVGKTPGGGNYFPACNFNNQKVVHLDISDVIIMDNPLRFYLDSGKIADFEQNGIVPYFTRHLFKKSPFYIKDKKICPKPTYLQSRFNYCPKCKEYKLRFDFGGFFD